MSPMLDGLRQDVVQAARTLFRRPGLSAVAVITLGLGIGGAARARSACGWRWARGPST